MKLYRYENITYIIGDEDYGITNRRVVIQLRDYQVQKETPQGYWIYPKRWVSKTANKRFAYPTLKEAWRSFKLRKKRQIQILSLRLEIAREADALPQPPCPPLLTPSSLTTS